MTRGRLRRGRRAGLVAAGALLAATTGSGGAGPPGLGLLRPEALVGLPGQLGVASLDDLPRYEIDLALDDVSGTLAGRLVLTYTNVTGGPVEALPLLLYPNVAGELGAPAADAATLAVSAVTTLEGPPAGASTVRPSMLEVRFATPVEPGARVRLELRYRGRLRVLPPGSTELLAQAPSAPAMLWGTRPSDYGLLAVGEGVATVALAYPALAPFHRGRFDPGRPARFGDLAWNQVAHFRVRTVVPPGVTVVTNLVDGPPQSVPELGHVVVSEGAVVRDFVLVAGRDLERQSRAVGPVRVTSVYRRRDAAAGARVLELAARALESFERRLGPYPYTELDVVQAPLVGGAGGAEFSALVLVASLLYRPPPAPAGLLGALVQAPRTGVPPGTGLPTSLLEDILEFTVAHEVAHQYLAGVVGHDSHREAVLDEPLVQYLASLAVEDRRGPAAARRALDLNARLGYALYRALGGPDGPARRETAAFRSPLEYAALVYGKAPYLYVALREVLGTERLEQALRAAVARHRFQLVTLEEWLGTLEAEAGGPPGVVRALARRWLEEVRGDQDLSVDDSGEAVLQALLPPPLAGALRQSLAALGLTPREFFRTLFGSAAAGAPLGPGLEPERALRELETLPR